MIAIITLCWCLATQGKQENEVFAEFYPSMERIRVKEDPPSTWELWGLIVLTGVTFTFIAQRAVNRRV
jgi:hypothetical protein